MNKAVGIRSIGVSFPSVVRTNDYWLKNYPDLIANSERKSLAKAFSRDSSASNLGELDLWTQEMAPYLSDPFRGTVERRVLGPGESSLTLEYSAARDAANAAKLAPDEIDLVIVASMFPECPGPGNAAPLAGEMGLKCASWNLESTCAGAIVALQNACALVRSGEYRNVLVVASCTYSRFMDEDDTVALFMGDGAGAFVVGSLEGNQGILGTKISNTAKTCGAFFNELAIDALGNPRVFLRVGKNPNKILRENFVRYFRACCEEALAVAGVTLEQINFFVFNTLISWYSSIYTRALGIDPERTIDSHSCYANIAVVSPIVNMYHAAQLGKIRENDLVLVYTFGGSSNVAATVMRWGDVALGPAPASSANLIGAPMRTPAGVR